MSDAPRLAYFISSHGFGHAARACAVIEACRKRWPELRCELFTATPEWFFTSSLAGPVGYHHVAVDFGLVQTNALEENLAATVTQLRKTVPFSQQRIDDLARILEERQCEAVLCDIAPVGLLAAQRSGLPSVLIENFTWDWIYRGYLADAPALAPIIDELAAAYATATWRIQAEPFCKVIPGAHRVAPISRRPRLDRQTLRDRLEIPVDAQLVMLTMGGIEWSYSGLESELESLNSPRLPWLLIAGGADQLERRGRVVRLPHRSLFYHPDLIHAADAVIGKLGYSTLAEVWSASGRLGYIARSRFPESAILESWVKTHLTHQRLDAEAFARGAVVHDLDALLDLPRNPPPTTDGAGEVAEILAAVLAGAPRGSAAEPV